MSSESAIGGSAAPHGVAQNRPLHEGLANGIDSLTEMLRSSVRADVCLIALCDPTTSEPKPYSATAVHLSTGNGSGGSSRLGARLLLRHADGPVLYNRPKLRSQRAGNGERRAQLGSSEARQRLAGLAGLLDVSSLLSVPLGEGDECIGRVYIGSRTQRYASGDVLPLWRSAKHACVLIESVRLAERLAKEVAHQERRRISRDLHDSAIQPYIGLKLGLEAMRRRLRGTEVAGDLDELIKIARDGVGELRQYVGTLKKVEARKQVASLLSAVRTQVRKFADFYGIDAQVVAESDIPVSGPLHDEILHIIREGLSNIRRHTSAARATVNLREAEGRLLLELVNDNASHARRRSFFPRSIGERARDLGGRVSVRSAPGNQTVVAVELPLQVRQ